MFHNCFKFHNSILMTLKVAICRARRPKSFSETNCFVFLFNVSVFLKIFKIASLHIPAAQNQIYSRYNDSFTSNNGKLQNLIRSCNRQLSLKMNCLSAAIRVVHLAIFTLYNRHYRVIRRRSTQPVFILLRSIYLRVVTTARRLILQLLMCLF